MTDWRAVRRLVPEVLSALVWQDARRLRDVIPRLREEMGRPCSQETIDDAIACAENRERAYDRRRSVLVHGDVHDANALQGADRTFKLIDPDGLRAEPACDLCPTRSE